MKTTIRMFVALCLLVLLTNIGCTSKPDKELSMAQQAMDEAQKVRAEDLAPLDWKTAIKTWDEAQAAYKDNKSNAQTLLLRAKSRFDKCSAIAKAKRDILSRDVGDMQLTIGDRYARVKAAVEGSSLSAKVKRNLKEYCTQIDKSMETLNAQVTEGDYLKAKVTAQDTLKKIFDAELIMAGKKPT
jgi:hypothetical protein